MGPQMCLSNTQTYSYTTHVAILNDSQAGNETVNFTGKEKKVPRYLFIHYNLERKEGNLRIGA